MLISRGLDLPWDAGLFAAPDQPVLVYTGSDAQPPAVAAPLEVVRLDDPEPAAVMRDLRARGVRALLCEGGPRLSRALLAAGVVDELFLTLASLLTGMPMRRASSKETTWMRRSRWRSRGSCAMTTSSTSATASAMTDDALSRAHEIATDWLGGLRERPVRAEGDPDGLRGALPELREEPSAVVEALAAAAGPGLVASAGPRYFGFVTGGALPAALAADWLTSAWDQNAALYSMSPAAATAESTALAWCRELLGLPTAPPAG